jgi:hypothetical protein
LGGPVVPDVKIIMAGSSGPVSAGANELDARAIVSAKPSVPSAGPSIESTSLSSGNRSRICASFSLPAALVIAARAPEFSSR